MRGSLLTTLMIALLLSGLFVANQSLAADQDIIINEIGAYESSGYEWLEIWNSGTTTVDLSGWVFWEGDTNHKLIVSSTDSIVGPGEYAVICQDENKFLEKYPGFAGSIFDSAWGSLKETGEEIGLKNASSTFIEKFTYLPAKNFSLEKRNPYLADYSASNWQEHVASNTVGFVNSNFSIATSSPAPTSTPTSTPLAEEPTSTSAGWEFIKINEVVSHPAASNEWVELYNSSTSSLNLAGGLICDNTGKGCKAATGTILAKSWRVIDLQTSRYLNNGGDSVILKNSTSTIVDNITYGKGLKAPTEGQALARKIDGVDSDSNTDWAITTQPTPGAKNNISQPSGRSGSGSRPAPPPAPKSKPKPTKPKPTAVTPTTTSVANPVVILNEIYPNPPGSDSEEEFIEIKNISKSTINLDGWKLADGARSFTLFGYIEPGQLMIWKRKSTKIALNNSTKEEIKLINDQKQLVDSTQYDKAPEGESYSRDKDNKWHWTTVVTPEKPNVIEKLSESDKKGVVKVAWKIKAPRSAEPGELLVFDAEDSADPRGGVLSFQWGFGDGKILSGGEVEHAFSSTGTYTVTVSASSTAGTSDSRKINLTVGPGLSIQNSKIIISEIVANPDGPDTKEFVELHNSGSSTINLAGWHLRHKTKTYTLPPGTFIPPGQALVFYRAVTKFTLNNSGDKVELLSPDKEVMDIVKVGQSLSGYSYSLVGDEWLWLPAPNPGEVWGGQVGLVPQVAGLKIEADDGGPSRLENFPTAMTISQARQSEKGIDVIVRGLVTALPGVFGSQYFYIADDDSGIQVYMYKKNFPKLQIGDAIEANGEITESRNIKRLKVKDKNDITVLLTDKKLAISTTTIEQIDDSITGKLIKLAGEITEIKSNNIYLDDGQDEMVAYVKSGTDIDKKQLSEGERVEITGIVEEAGSGWQLWPRSQADIKVLAQAKPEADQEQATLDTSENNSKKLAENYLLATTAGIGLVLMSLLIMAIKKK